MESLSRPFHTRKLSNASNFSGKNAYDGVFSGHRQKYAGVPATNVQDYREIFGNSQAASSIPVLDLSTFEKSSDASSSSLRSSKPDYSKIFGGFRDEDIAVSYEELFARDDARAPSSTRSTSQDSDDLSEQSFDDLKQFNMSYHKINQRGKDGLDNGRTHVAKLHDVPGFTCFFNETAPPQKIEAQKQKSIGIDSSKESFDDKQLSESDIRSQHEDNLFKTFEINLKSPSASPINADNRKNYPKRSTANDTSESVPEEFTPPCFDEELDVNSAAATSAAALKKAIEKAQESIRIAKESVGRKKKGLRSFSSKTFKDSLKVEGKMQDVVANEEQKSNRKHGGTVGLQDFMEGEKLFVAKKVIDEINGKISESANRSAIPIQSSNGFKDTMVVSNSTQVEGEIESRTLDSAINHEFAARPFEAADAEKNNNATSVFEQENQRNNMSVGDYEGEIKLTKPTTGVLEESKPVEKALDSEVSSRRPKDFLVDESYDKKLGDSEETVKVDTPGGSNENKDEVELCNAHELVNGLNNFTMSQNAEDEKKASQESNQNHIELPKNEKQEEVLEQKHIEKVENAERHTSDDEASENESRSSSSSPETHKEEETSETFYDVLELEMNETAQTCDIKVEESEVTLKDDYEMKQEDNHMGETNGKSVDEACDQEFDENSSIDDNDMEESDLIDNSMETTQEVADVTRASCEFQAEDTAAMKAAYSSEEDELFEKTSIDQTASDDNEDEYEVKSDSDFEQNETEENDVRSESSSGTIHGVEIDTDESKKEYNIIDDEKTVFTEEGESNNIQLSHKEIPEIRSAVEIKASQSEIGETGPSKVEGKEQQRKIDEVNVIEREREKNRLAVDRVIREARERAFAEARERAERAAVEKATTEVKQRMMADVREKIAKASVGAKSTFERTSEQSKLKAERAAVERATAEARQRALEKAMSQKCVSEADVRVNKESSSSDLHNSSGTSSESALRSKAKLEKHNRIMERAAKALAEKEKRDLLAQKEQAERNRLAENLDADIKRWSRGKERNLRALLSTLQYILGPDSGWQPISLTEIITTSAVKKAYRKATLCVHPDKLQQRGASIQHKYICEKVFDLLKAAWNRFNSEES